MCQSAGNGRSAAPSSSPGQTFARVADKALTFERRGAGYFEASTGYPRPQYMIAVCSDEALRPFPVTVYIDTGQLNSGEDNLRNVLAAEQDRLRAVEAIPTMHRYAPMLPKLVHRWPRPAPRLV